MFKRKSANLFNIYRNSVDGTYNRHADKASVVQENIQNILFNVICLKYFCKCLKAETFHFDLPLTSLRVRRMPRQ
jgi:hypothetical protein